MNMQTAPQFKTGLPATMRSLKRRICTLLSAVALGIFAHSAHAADSRPFYMGFTPWPWDTTWSAVQDTYQFINQNADIISHHIEEGVPWTEALADAPFDPKMMESWALRKQLTGSNLKVFLSISPLNQLRDGMALYRGAGEQMPLPSAFEGLRLNSAQVKKAYLNYARRAVEYFKPDYLAIAIEANELFDNNPGMWDDFAELYTETYRKLKAEYPTLPVFFTASLHNVVNPERGDPAKTWSKLEALWLNADIAGASFYPFLQRPLDLANPFSALQQLKAHTSKPIAISESGYPGKPPVISALKSLPATDDIQKNVYYGMLSLAASQNYEFVILWTYRDYDALWDRLGGQLPEWGSLWRDVGILDGEGKPRGAKQVWDIFRSLPHK